MTDETYEGWSNWDTWEFKLLLDNDEPAYHQKCTLARKLARKQLDGRYSPTLAAIAVRRLLPMVRELELEAGLERDERIKVGRVNFQEIAESLRDEGIELLAYEAKE